MQSTGKYLYHFSRQHYLHEKYACEAFIFFTSDDWVFVPRAMACLRQRMRGYNINELTKRLKELFRIWVTAKKKHRGWTAADSNFWFWEESIVDDVGTCTCWLQFSARSVVKLIAQKRGTDMGCQITFLSDGLNFATTSENLLICLWRNLTI